MKTAELIEHHDAAWREASGHRFLGAVRDGTLPERAFENWLVQDHLFVADGLVFQSRLIARSPRRDQKLLIGGLAALEDELGWFEEQAARRDLDLAADRQPANEAYRDFLMGLEDEPYPVALTALWALERAYLESWRNAAPGHGCYREFVAHWTTPEFAGYVSGLESAADAALDSAGPGDRERAGDAFAEIIRLEWEFWEMALDGDGA